MLNFIPRILVTSLISFHVLSVYGQFHSAYHLQTPSFSDINHFSVNYQYALNFIPRIINMRLISYRVLSVLAKFHSTYYQHMLNFIPCIR
jgi:hypothetical protein